MLRSVVPPPSPEMMWSIFTPSAANRPFSMATAHGRVAVTRPYWLTAISAAEDGREWQSARIAKTIEYTQRPRRIGFLPCLRKIMSRPPKRRNRMRLRQFAVRGSGPTSHLRRSESPLLWPAAEIDDDALLAQRAARHARVAAVQDEPVVGVQLVGGRHHLLEVRLDLERILAGREPGAVADPEDVGIDRNGRLAERDVEHDIGGLAPDPGQGLERLAQRRHHAAVLGDQLLRQRDDVLRLGVEQPDRLDV